MTSKVQLDISPDLKAWLDRLASNVPETTVALPADSVTKVSDSVTKLDNNVTVVTKLKGRPRLYSGDAERQREYRKRRRNELLGS